MTAYDSDPARASLDADVIYRWHDHAFKVDLEVDLDGELFFRREWRESIERRLV